MIALTFRRFTSIRAHRAEFAVIFALAFLLPAVAFGQPKKSMGEPASKNGKAASPPGECPVEVRFTDNSVLKLTLKEERIDFTTAYGKISIPVADIRRIEFGLRVPDDVSKRVEAAVTDLGDKQFRRREAAGAILLGLREKAYPAILRATQNTDMEIANRAEELVKKLRDTVSAELLQVREYDIIHTDTSKIVGKIDAPTLRAHTAQFGEVQLRLADIFILSTKGGTDMAIGTANAVDGPTNLINFQNEVGKTFAFKVTGTTNGSLWGTDSYTTDSTLALAAVHAGLLQPGQTGVIRVTIAPSPAIFVGSTRHGVTSSPYQQYPAAYRLQK